MVVSPILGSSSERDVANKPNSVAQCVSDRHAEHRIHGVLRCSKNIKQGANERSFDNLTVKAKTEIDDHKINKRDTTY